MSRSQRLSARVASAAITVLCVTGDASAQSEPCDAARAVERADHLRANLANEAERMRSWKVTWTVVFGAGVIGQVAIAELVEGPDSESSRDRRTFDVGAVKAGLGAVTTPFLAPKIEVPEPILGESACDDLKRLQAALTIAARKQAKGVAWYQYLPGAAVNVAGILYLGLAHDLWVESLLGAAFGTAVGSIKVLTQPRRAIDWDKEGAPPGAPPWLSRIRISAGPSHVGLSLSF